MNKHSAVAARREEILRIVRDSSVFSQEELQEILEKRGHRVTQPTLSRDLRELELVKTPSGYVAPSAIEPAVATVHPFINRERRTSRLEQAVDAFVLSAVKAGSLVILRTRPAEAQPVARAIDEADLPEIAGTIAGDDTIFIAARSVSAAGRLVRSFSTSSPGARPRRARA